MGMYREEEYVGDGWGEGKKDEVEVGGQHQE